MYFYPFQISRRKSFVCRDLLGSGLPSDPGLLTTKPNYIPRVSVFSVVQGVSETCNMFSFLNQSGQKQYNCRSVQQKVHIPVQQKVYSSVQQTVYSSVQQTVYSQFSTAESVHCSTTDIVQSSTTDCVQYTWRAG